MSTNIEGLVKIKTFGNISQETVKKLLDIIGECYKKLGPPMTYSVDLNIFEVSEGSRFFASHDALHGKPTINISLDRIAGLPSNVVVGGVRRQAAHSILHGAPEYYKIKFPEELKQAIYDFGLPENFVLQILYGASMAVKEYNVTKFLVDGGFVEDQIAYIKFMLQPTSEESQAWDVAKLNPLARIIYLVMIIRDVSCAIPLLEDSRLGAEIKECLDKKVEHLSTSYKSTIQKIIGEMIQKFSEDTFQNIDLLTKVIVEDIIKKELEFL